MPEQPEITFHGAARTVTGSCMELRYKGHGVLIDCGLFQGPRTLEALNREPFSFDPSRITAVVLSHAHIDHSGLLPRLVAEGFDGPIHCTPATKDLLYHMLPDSGRIQEYEAERRNRRADRAGEQPFEPIYTEADALAAHNQCRPAPLESWITVAPEIRARFWNAGHILGSASIEVETGSTRLLFSGDLGPQHKAFHPDPVAPAGVDHVICETTYGNRVREDITIEERRTLLEAEIKGALARKGNLVIPVFALERTQELLLDIASLVNAGRISHSHVFIDSPLATRATGVFAQHAHALEDLGSGEVFAHPAFHFVQSTLESMRLNDVSGSIILSASGMCEAGRIRHHLRHNLGRRESTILFVGFQAAGTLGRTILDGAARVRISGHDVAVRAQVRRLDSYSAHADQQGLRAWLGDRQPIEGSLFLTHGEADASEEMRKISQSDNLANSIVTPQIGERYALPHKAAARRLATGRSDLQEALERDWQNDYAEFATSLKQELREIGTERDRREALRRMRQILRSFQKQPAKSRTGR